MTINLATNTVLISEGNDQKQLTTKVFAKAGIDNVTSGMCKHQQRFGQTNFNLVFSC